MQHCCKKGSCVPYYRLKLNFGEYVESVETCCMFVLFKQGTQTKTNLNQLTMSPLLFAVIAAMLIIALRKS